jgi:hypothetical protein
LVTFIMSQCDMLTNPNDHATILANAE